MDKKMYFVSYPKTGRTWLRVLIGKYLCDTNNFPEKDALRTMHIVRASGLPRIVFTHDGSEFTKSPAVLRSYKSLSSDKSHYKGRKVIFLTRDIKDTLVSSYFQASRSHCQVYKGSISEFIRHDYYGVRKFVTFHKYWYESGHIPKDFLLIRYEELHKDTENILDQVLRFIGEGWEKGRCKRNGVPSFMTRKEALREAINFASFDNLRKMEVDNYLDSERLCPFDVNDPESFKTRKGKVGGYKEYLSREDIEYIEEMLCMIYLRDIKISL